MSGPVTFIGAFFEHWIVVLFFVVLAFSTAYFYVALKKRDRFKIVEWLNEPDAGKLYRDMVGWTLERIDKALTPGNAVETSKPYPASGWWRNFDWFATPLAPSPEAAADTGRAPFGWTLFDRALLFAVAYPILLLIAGWAWTGEAGGSARCRCCLPCCRIGRGLRRFAPLSCTQQA